MPHFPHTPEALLGRNDSKNPATTCKGITSSGRPCRRALASPKATRKSSNPTIGGVVAVMQEDGEFQGAEFFCWQHKDQAEENVQEEIAAQKKGRRVKRRSTELYPLQERSSIDTLVQKLGIDGEENGKTSTTNNPKPPRRTQTSDFASPHRPNQAPYAEKYNLGGSQRPSNKPKRQGFWASLCCMTGGDDDYVEIVRHKKRVDQTRPPEMAPSSPSTTRPASAAVASRKPIPHRPASESDPRTANLLSRIPEGLSPQTTSALFTELTKPISPYDEEGYIYIFWLTPQTKSAPSESTARSLLQAPPAPTKRRISDVMTEYSSNCDNDDKTIMLKIGRANNITRRMNEWQRQCGYALNLIRWYPYISKLPLHPDLTREVHKVPCVKRVERLIHLELAEKQVKRKCGACGKEHREWFEVEASQDGVRRVDEVVRRWVGWGEELAARG